MTQKSYRIVLSGYQRVCAVAVLEANNEQDAMQEALALVGKRNIDWEPDIEHEVTRIEAVECAATDEKCPCCDKDPCNCWGEP